MNAFGATRSELTQVRDKAEAAQKVVKVKIKHLKGMLEKIEAEKVKAEADGALEEKRRRTVEARVMEMKKQAEG